MNDEIEGNRTVTKFDLRAAFPKAFAAIAIVYAAATLVALSPFWVERALIDDDARMHLLGFYALRFPEAFTDRFLSDYSLAYVPPGYRMLNESFAQFIDPQLFAKILGAVLLITTWSLAWKIGSRLGGLVGAAGSLLLCVHSGFILLHTFGGLPRSFGYPLLFAFVWAWIKRRDIAIALILLAQAAFYPPLFLVCWSASALRVAVHAPAFLTSRRRGLLAFAGTSVVAAAMLVVFARSPDSWGRLATLEDAAAMGEFQRDGGRIKILPLYSVSKELYDSAERGLQGIAGASGQTGPAVGDGAGDGAGVLVTFAFLLVVFPAVLVARPRPSWAATLFVSALVVYSVARQLAFHLGEPDRSFKYTLPVLIVLAWPLAWGAARSMTSTSLGTATSGLSVHNSAVLRVGASSNSVLTHRNSALSRLGALWQLGLAGAVLAVFAVHGVLPADPSAITVDARSELPLHDAIAAIDPAGNPILVAGWPGGPIDNVPLLAGREVFVDYEHAHPYYLGHYAEVRRRIEETLRLIYSTEVAAAREIRDSNALTHLILERGTLAEGSDRPRLFRPLDTTARRLDEESPPELRIFRDPVKAWIAYQDDLYFLIDLRALDGDASR